MSSKCDLLVLGGAGLAGAAIVEAAQRRGLTVLSASRRGAVSVDARDEADLRRLLDRLAPSVVVNAAAIVSIPDCEADPGSAWVVNARVPAVLAAWTRAAGAKLVHISTDHYYSGDGRRPHGEDEPVRLLNEYARTKYAAEALALSDPEALVLRTNIVGLRSATGRSFGEWALQLVADDAPGVLFDDQFVSTIDVWAFADALLDLSGSEAPGVVNLAASSVFSKAEFVQALAARLGRPLTRARVGSVGEQSVARPDSLGLDVSKAEQLLGRRLPGLDRVVDALAVRSQLEREPIHALEQ